MKFLIAILCLTTTIVYAQPKTPEEVGETVFQLLKDLDEENFEDYLSHHITMDILKELVADTNISERIREDFGSVTEEVLIERYKEMQGELLIAESEITDFFWKDIKFKEFTYNHEDGDGIEGISGELTFTANKEEYALELAALHWNEVYSLFFIDFGPDFLNEGDMSEEELQQMIEELEAELENLEELPPAPGELATIKGTFRSIAGVKDPLSCHCSNGGYLTDIEGVEYPICLDEDTDVSECKTVSVTGYMEESVLVFDEESPCTDGVLYLMYVESINCED